MGFISAIKKIFGGLGGDDAELREARARHKDIVVDEPAEKTRYPTEQERMAQYFDIREEIDSFRTSFFFGRYLTRKFGMYPRHDKLKEELDALERKKEEKRKQEEGEGD